MAMGSLIQAGWGTKQPMRHTLLAVILPTMVAPSPQGQAFTPSVVFQKP